MSNMLDTSSLTNKQVFILILIIVGAIAFLETNSWRDFGLKFIVYGAVSEFVVIFWGTMFNKE